MKEGGHPRIEKYRVSAPPLPPFQAGFDGRCIHQELATYWGYIHCVSRAQLEIVAEFHRGPKTFSLVQWLIEHYSH
jgi:hypothetical protein